jgi:hypothetical protein
MLSNQVRQPQRLAVTVGGDIDLPRQSRSASNALKNAATVSIVTYHNAHCTVAMYPELPQAKGCRDAMLSLRFTARY